MKNRPDKGKVGRVKAGQAKKSRFSFVPDVIGELKKVTWPTRQETIRLSAMVLVVCVILGLILGGVDYVFTQLVAKVFLGG
ncbi:MAG: preprotein translocase subunit SecE [Dehalococcoidia bacterium]|nr:MAG: preprotein translocase subunit SecE [Dehalococcoidia bacterium]